MGIHLNDVGLIKLPLTNIQVVETIMCKFIQRYTKQILTINNCKAQVLNIVTKPSSLSVNDGK